MKERAATNLSILIVSAMTLGLWLPFTGCCHLREGRSANTDDSFFDGGEICRSFLSSDSQFMAGAQLGLDAHRYTDAILIGLHGGIRRPLRRIPLSMVLSLDLGLGSDDFDGRFDIVENTPGSGSNTFGTSGELDFNVLHVRTDLLYPLYRPRRQPIVLYALAGPTFYQWTVTDCRGPDCRHSDFGFNVGGGVYYGIFGVEAVTGIAGDIPDLAVRLKTTIPIGSTY